ncbi:MAG: ABC transporter permease subunit [Methanomassiliicoccales archaeon]|nr:ABC transporter permease subunit [Methanomassiliicoccales archaeon]
MSSNLIGLWTMVVFSARKLLQNRRWIIMVLLTALVTVVMGYAAVQDETDMNTASDLMALLLIAFLLPVLALIYGASMIRNEIDDRSIVQVITSPLDRRIAYVGYYLALTIVLSALLAVATLVGGLTFIVLCPNGGGGIELMLAFIVVQCLGALVYSSLFLLMGTVIKQPVYLGLLYVFVWEGFVASVPGAIGSYTIRQQLRVVASGMISKGDITNVTGDGAVAAIVLIAFAIVFVTLGAFLFREMEVP